MEPTRKRRGRRGDQDLAWGNAEAVGHFEPSRRCDAPKSAAIDMVARSQIGNEQPIKCARPLSGLLTGRQDADVLPFASLNSGVTCRLCCSHALHGDRMTTRRKFVSLLGGAAAAWPVVARRQQSERVHRLGLLVGGALETTSETKASVAAFRQALAQLGWTEGRNLQIDSFSAVGNPDKVSEYAEELATLAPALAALAPDVILTNGTKTMEAMVRATPTVPIVFVNVTDPSGAGFVDGQRGLAAMPPVLPIFNIVLSISGLNYSKRLRRA